MNILAQFYKSDTIIEVWHVGASFGIPNKVEQDILSKMRRIYLRVCLMIAVIVTIFGGLTLAAFYAVGSLFALWLLHSLTQAVRTIRPGNYSSATGFLWFKVWWRYPLAALLIAWVSRYPLADAVAFTVGISMVPWLITALAVQQAWRDRHNDKPPTNEK